MPARRRRSCSSRPTPSPCRSSRSTSSRSTPSHFNELVAGADAAIFAQHQEIEADRDRFSAIRRQHLPAQLDRVVMAVDAVAQAEDIALLLHPLLVGVGDARLDAGVTDRLDGARQMTGVLLPERANGGAAPFGIGLVPDADVTLDELLDVGHAGSPSCQADGGRPCLPR